MRMSHLILAVVALAPLSATAAEEHVGRDAERGDPARWYQPADTPQEKYRTAMKEAVAALAEALKECRAQPAMRKECEVAARREHQNDVERARGFLARPTQG